MVSGDGHRGIGFSGFGCSAFGNQGSGAGRATIRLMLTY